MITAFRGKQIGYLLSPANERTPRPVTIVRDDGDERPYTPDERRHNLEVINLRRKMDQEFETGISLIIGMLGPTPQKRVQSAIRSLTHSPERIFDDIIEILEREYGQDEGAVASELMNN